MPLQFGLPLTNISLYSATRPVSFCVCLWCAAAFGTLEAAQQLHVRANIVACTEAWGRCCFLCCAHIRLVDLGFHNATYPTYMQADYDSECRHGLLGPRVLARQQAP